MELYIWVKNEHTLLGYVNYYTFMPLRNGVLISILGKFRRQVWTSKNSHVGSLFLGLFWSTVLIGSFILLASWFEICCGIFCWVPFTGNKLFFS